MKADIRYGKHTVSFYRTHPVRGLLAGRVSIDVFGDNFLPAYTEGDNREVVATDTMKNFVYAMALEYQGATHEGFAAVPGRPLPHTLSTDAVAAPLRPGGSVCSAQREAAQPVGG